MSARVRLAVALALLVSGAALGLAGADGAGPTSGEAPNDSRLELATVYPNPVADGDSGEFVVLRARESTALGNYTLSDGEDTISLPNRTVRGRIALSAAPERTRNRTGAGTRVAEGQLPALANSGEELTLRRNDRTVATLSYAEAPEGERGRFDAGEIDWRPLGATDRPVVTADGGSVRAFVLPDAPTIPRETLAAADDRILLAGYTLTSSRVVAALRNASRRGVAVRVLVDAAPVGGMTRREATALDRLVAANVSVRVLGGDHARYDYHHAKYAVVDGRALVTTENWKPAGTGGHSSRGWGVIVHQQAIVSGLATTFHADRRWRDAIRWRTFRRGTSFAPAQAPPSNGTYPRRFAPRRVVVDRVELLVAPDNAESRVVDLLANASESIHVQQVSIGSRRQPFLRATLRAARRGVDVRILLSSAWYVEKENRRLVRWLNDLAARKNLPLTARLAEPRGRYEKIHAKGVVIDGDQVVLGSLNWNNNSARDNREVVVVLHGTAVAEYYGAVFAADWQGGVGRIPLGVGLTVLVGALLAALVARRITFGTERGVDPDGDGQPTTRRRSR